MVKGNSDIQNAHLRKYKDYVVKNMSELHRDNKAYEEFKRVPDYGKGCKANER